MRKLTNFLVDTIMPCLFPYFWLVLMGIFWNWFEKIIEEG